MSQLTKAKEGNSDIIESLATECEQLKEELQIERTLTESLESTNKSLREKVTELQHELEKSFSKSEIDELQKKMLLALHNFEVVKVENAIAATGYSLYGNKPPRPDIER